ncbi:MAG: DUF3426 domain-containing protein [Arenicella sp.]
MIEFTRCPKCSTLYELEGVDLSASSGWVQCGDCDRKFKASSHAVETEEISLTVSNNMMDKSMEMAGAGSVSKDDLANSMQVVDDEYVQIEGEEELLEDIPIDYARKQLSENVHGESEFSEKTIILPDEVSEDDDFEDIFDAFGDDIFHPELIDEEEPESRKVQVSRRYSELNSEFSEEEIVIQPEYSEKTILEEELEATTTTLNDEETVSQELDNSSFNVGRFFATAACLIIAVGFVALFSLQLHTRGTYEWIPQNKYDGLLSRAPYLSKLEKTQTNLSAIHLASTRMEVSPDDSQARVITLQLVNRSYSNQAYPDFQLEFTDAKGDTIARRIVLPSLYLEKGHLGLLESREAKIVLLNLKSLPVGAVGYQIKVVQQSS